MFVSRPHVVATLGLAVVLVAAGCGSGGTPAPAGGTAAPAAGNAVSIVNYAFNPSSLTVKVGDTVTWTNGSGTPHTVTADDGSFNSGTVQGGTPFQHTFSAAGTFSYHCSIHSSMKATITVSP